VRQVIIDLDPASILDLGCGGLPLVLGSADYEYVGIDYASEAIAMACANDPCGDYRLSAIHSAQVEPADLVLLVDVLPYQSDADALHDILEKAAQSARIWILLSVLEQPPDSTRGPARYFHQPVDDLLARIPSFNFQMLGFASGQRFYLGQTAMRCDTRRGQ
jgi:predicted TPR repeat methyltransferase